MFSVLCIIVFQAPTLAPWVQGFSLSLTTGLDAGGTAVNHTDKSPASVPSPFWLGAGREDTSGRSAVCPVVLSKAWEDRCGALGVAREVRLINLELKEGFSEEVRV